MNITETIKPTFFFFFGFSALGAVFVSVLGSSFEFLSALLDNLHEDLNRITHKNYMELEEQKKGESDEIASKRWWDYYKSRDDSIIVDLFKGQFKTTITCCECNHKSVNFDTFMTLDLPIPQKKTQIQFKLFTNSGNYIDLNIKADENTEMKDIILKSISYLDKKNYIENTEYKHYKKNYIIFKYIFIFY